MHYIYLHVNQEQDRHVISHWVKFFPRTTPLKLKGLLQAHFPRARCKYHCETCVLHMLQVFWSFQDHACVLWIWYQRNCSPWKLCTCRYRLLLLSMACCFNQYQCQYMGIKMMFGSSRGLLNRKHLYRIKIFNLPDSVDEGRGHINFVYYFSVFWNA